MIAIHRFPNDALRREIEARGQECHAIGDVVAPRRIEAVVVDAEKLAREI
ncbi:MAG: hypothetical protein AAF384_06380 [Pseudomonadota bacterium]